MSDISSTASYFRKSPFRSRNFNVATAVLAVFVFSGIRSMGVQPPTLKPSEAILGLILLPVAVWILSLLLHWEMRAIGELASDTPAYTQLVQMHYLRLARLHWGLTIGVTIFSWGIIQALTTTFH